MKKLITPVFVLLAILMPSISNASDVSTKVGTIELGQGNVNLYVDRSGVGRNERIEMHMLVSDQYSVNKIYFYLPPEKMEQLRDLLNATMVELKKQEGESSPEAREAHEKAAQMQKSMDDQMRAIRKK